jgi:hypothetical protein
VPIGMVIFSSARREDAPELNHSNIRLGKSAEAILDAERSRVVIVAQWEVAQQLRSDNYRVDHVVELPQDGSHLDNKDVWEIAKQLFRQQNVTKVIPIAPPLLQMHLVCRAIKQAGFEIDKRPIGKIGFSKNPLKTQRWTRSTSGC